LDRPLSLACCCAAVLLVHSLAGVAQQTPPRKPWTTSRIVGSPESPPPFKVVRAFPRLKFQNPVVCTFAPGSDRFFIGEQSGKIFSFPPREDVSNGDLFVDLAKEIKTVEKTPNAKEVEACYGLVFHPKFAENRKCYICYTVRKPGEKNLPEGTRVSEFVVRKTEPPTVDAQSERILITFLQGGHNGGDLHFGPDGLLYISTGDATDPNPPDVFKTGQDCSDLLSSILRIDVDRRDPGKEYAVPKDNPFVGIKNVRPEIWAFGFRNPWRMSFDRKTGDLWLGDVGWELWEMVHRVTKGGNYGWSIVEGRQPINTQFAQGPGPILPPTIELSHSISMSVTGGYVYYGKRFPELQGQYIFGDWETRRLWAATTAKDKPVTYQEIADPSVRLVAFGQDHAGEIYLVDYDGGTLHALERNAGAVANTAFPKKLSETGLFADAKTRKPANGVIPFSINASQWADGATAERLVGLPGSSKIVWHPKDVPIQGTMFSRQFEFPDDSVLARTFVWAPGTVDPKRDKPIETQILHYDGKQWRGYSYVWNDDGTDATLAPLDGMEKQYRVADARAVGGARVQKWTVPSRSQCLQCHNPWAQTTLAFNVPQLNDGRTFAELNKLGVFDRRDEHGRPLQNSERVEAAKWPKLASDTRAHSIGSAHVNLEESARTYLHVNCAHCHRNGGGGSVTFEIPVSIALKDAKAVDVRPMRGDFGLKDARIIASGDPHRSVLYYRMAKTGSGRMPHLGSEVPDRMGLDLVYGWISSLGSSGSAPIGIPTSPVKPLDVDAKLKTVGGALELALFLRNGAFDRPRPARAEHPELPPREAVLAKASGSSDPNIRDLFEHWQPPERRRPTLGATPNAAALLAMNGDPVRGRDLFWNNAALQCKTCHRIGAEGTALGPDLTKIATQRTRAELLDNLIQPSAKIEPAYTNYAVQTKDGRTVTGLLVRRDTKEVVLKDAKNQEFRIPAADVERLQPSRTSLMPDALLKDLTAQEAADLLEFLSGLK
jgi:putative heme-binding domain-containing protein